MRPATIQKLRNAQEEVRDWAINRKRTPSEAEIQKQVQKWISEGYAFRTIEMAFMNLYADHPEIEEKMADKHLLDQSAA